MCWAVCREDGCLLAGHATGRAWTPCYVTYLTRSEIRGAAAVQGCGQGEGVSSPAGRANSTVNLLFML